MPGGVPGASAERTRLAWRRTVLAVTVVALLTVRLAVRHGLGPAGGLAIAAAVGSWLFLLWISSRRIQAMAADRPPATSVRLPLAVALVTVAFAIVGLALVTSQI